MALAQASTQPPSAPPRAGSRLADLDAIIEGAFVAPRVIDQRAFDELAGVLKGLVRDAATQASTLEASTVEVKGLGTQLRDATQALESRLETANKALPAIEQRVTRAERVLEAARSELATRVAQIKDAALKDLVIDDATIRALVADRARELAKSIAQEAIREELATLRQSVSDAIRQESAGPLAQAVERAAAARSDVDLGIVRATTLLESLSTASGGAQATVDRLQGITDASDVRIAAISERLAHHAQEAREADAHLTGSIAQAASTAGNMTRQAIEQIEVAANKATDAASDARASATMATTSIAKAQDVERTVDRLCRESMDRLAQMQDSCKTTVAACGQTCETLEYARGQAIEVQTSLVRAHEESAAHIRALVDGVATQAVQELVSSAEQRVRDAAAAAIAASVEDANRRAEAIRAEMESEFQQHERKHREAIAASTRDMADRIGAMSSTIETLRARAAEVDQAMQTVADLRDATQSAVHLAAEMRELAANNALDNATLLQRSEAIAQAQHEAEGVVSRLTALLSNTNERTEALAHSLDYMRQEYEHLLQASQEAARITAPVAQELSRQREQIAQMVEHEIPDRVAKAIDGVVNPAVGKVQEMGDWLSALIQQAGQLGTALDRVTLKHQPRLRAIEAGIAEAQAAVTQLSEQVASQLSRSQSDEPGARVSTNEPPQRTGRDVTERETARGQAFLEHAYPELARPADPAPLSAAPRAAAPQQATGMAQPMPNPMPIQMPPLMGPYSPMGLDPRRRV